MIATAAFLRTSCYGVKIFFLPECHISGAVSSCCAFEQECMRTSCGISGAVLPDGLVFSAPLGYCDTGILVCFFDQGTVAQPFPKYC